MNLTGLESAIRTANNAAASSTTLVASAAADEISAAIAALFSSHAQNYQTIGAQAVAFHQQSVETLSAGAGSYVSAEAASASPLEGLINLLNPAEPPRKT